MRDAFTSAAGGVTACCTICLLVTAGVVGGRSGFVIGGIALGAVAVVAVSDWMLRPRGDHGSPRRRMSMGVA